MIRYKVTRRDRISCLTDSESRFSHKYLQNTIITAAPRTLGIFTFKTKEDAQAFKGYDSWLILRVQPIGRGKTPKKISLSATTESLEAFIRGHSLAISNQIVPPGTICYPAVKVLD